MTYEYLLAGLPELKAGADIPISMEKLEELLDEQLSESDNKQLDSIYIQGKLCFGIIL